jgi:uncharacterized SAM-binding protein YcdF (DUF218 family)
MPDATGIDPQRRESLAPFDSVIVIFGAAVRPDGRASTALYRRVQAAYRLGRSLRAPLYLPTGGVGRFGPSEASVMAGMLRERGVPADRILLEETATSTMSSVLAVARLLSGRAPAVAVYAASNAYHLPRCLVLMLLAGLPAWACPPPPGPAARGWRRRWYWRLREAVALPVDALLMIGARVGKTSKQAEDSTQRHSQAREKAAKKNAKPKT